MTVGDSLYDRAMTALEGACSEADAILTGLDQMDQDVALRLCAQTAHAFADAEMGLRAMRERALSQGRRLYQARRRRGEAT